MNTCTRRRTRCCRAVPYPASCRSASLPQRTCPGPSTTATSNSSSARQYVQLNNATFLQLSLHGVSIVVASGDSGAQGAGRRCSEGILPNFPASSTFVTAVGSTELRNATFEPLPDGPPLCSEGNWECVSGGEEAAVSMEFATFVSGGGFRAFHRSGRAVSERVRDRLVPPGVLLAVAAVRPQQSAVHSGRHLHGRPRVRRRDVAAAGALMLTLTGKPLDLLNPLLYDMARAQPDRFHDIRLGSNAFNDSELSCMGFVASKGWDAVTGQPAAAPPPPLSTSTPASHTHTSRPARCSCVLIPCVVLSTLRRPGHPQLPGDAALHRPLGPAPAESTTTATPSCKCC